MRNILAAYVYGMPTNRSFNLNLISIRQSNFLEK